MHAKNIHHEQPQESSDLQRQQQLKLFAVQLLRYLDKMLYSLDTLNCELDREGLPVETSDMLLFLKQRLRDTVQALAEGQKTLRDQLQELLFNEATRPGEETTGADRPHARFRWLQRLDSALFSPPHTFASVLALVVTQLETTVAADPGPPPN